LAQAKHFLAPGIRLSFWPVSIVRWAPLHQLFKAAFVGGVPLLSLAYDARKLLDWIDFRQRSCAFDQVPIIALPPAAQPSHNGKHLCLVVPHAVAA
jgi:hypothetical protein